MANGIRTTNLDRQFAVDELLGNVTTDGVEKTARIPIEALTTQLAGSGPFVFGNTVYALTKAALDGYVPLLPGAGGVVLNDPDVTLNGYYARSGGVWVKGRGFSDTVAELTIVGGSPNTVLANANVGVDPGSVLVFFIEPVATNTGAVTLSVSGGAAKPVENINGESLSSGEWPAGRILLLTDEGDHYRILSDPAVDALLQQAIDLVAEAEDLSTPGDGTVTEPKLADGAVTDPKLANSLKARLTGVAPDRPTLAAMSGGTYQAVELLEPGRVGLFKWDSSNLSAAVTADTSQGIYVAPLSAPTGASGAWVRQYEGAIRPEWFGAKGDAVYYKDAGAVTAGSAALTIAGFVNDASLVGKVVQVRGAGTSGDAATAFQSVIVSTSGAGLTMAANAVTTVTTARVLIGTDDTDAINKALGYGQIYLTPGRSYLFTSMLIVATNGGIVSEAPAGRFCTLTDMERPIVVVETVRKAVFVGFAGLGPHLPKVQSRNRFLTVGFKADLTGLSAAEWDASGIWLDHLDVEAFGTAFQFTNCTGMRFGDLNVRDACAVDSVTPNVGYGITGSCRDVRGKSLRHVNINGRGRHAVYWNGVADGCWIDDLYAEGFDLNPFNCRITQGDVGIGNGFGYMFAKDCNTDPNDTAGCINFVQVSNTGGSALAGSGGFERAILVNCGGKALSLLGVRGGQYGMIGLRNHVGWGSMTAGNKSLIKTDDQNGRFPGDLYIEGLQIEGSFASVADILIHISDSDGIVVNQLIAAGKYNVGVNFSNSNNCKVMNHRVKVAANTANSVGATGTNSSATY